MARILATWELGLRYGHIANIAPVASSLTRHGHEIFLAARDPAGAQRVAPAPFREIMQAPVYNRRSTQRETLTYGQVIAAAGFVDAESVTGLVHQWLALFDRINPDALIVEHAPVSLLAAHVAGIQAVRIGPSFTAPPARHPLPALLPWAMHSPAEIDAAGHIADRIVRDVCCHFGAPVLNRLSDLLVQAPVFALTWPELDHYGADPDTFYYGPLASIGAPTRPSWPDGHGPRVLVYLPFDLQSGHVMAKALGALGWPVIWHAATPSTSTLALNIHYSEAPVDLVAMCAEADIFVGRGGHGAGGAILRGGLPQLLVPDTLESLLVSYRLREAGVAMMESGLADVSIVTAALHRIATDKTIRETAQRFRSVYARYDADAAAETVANDIVAALNISHTNEHRAVSFT